MPSLEITDLIIQKVESHLIGSKQINFKPIKWLQQLIISPFRFLHFGIGLKMKGMFLWSVLSFILQIASAALVNKLGIKSIELINIILLSTLFIPIFIIAFAMPSTYGHSNVKQTTAIYIIEQLKDCGIKSSKQIDQLKKSISLYEDRADVRIKSMKWLAGLLWAAFIYYFSKGIEGQMTSIPSFMNYSVTSAVLFLTVAATYLIIWGYEAAVNTLFRSIDFGINDYCLIMENYEQ